MDEIVCDSERILDNFDKNISRLIMLKNTIYETANRMYGEVPEKCDKEDAKSCIAGHVGNILYKQDREAEIIESCLTELKRINKFI
jgi:chaperonin cofactor prefoldin